VEEWIFVECVGTGNFLYAAGE